MGKKRTALFLQLAQRGRFLAQLLPDAPVVGVVLDPKRVGRQGLEDPPGRWFLTWFGGHSDSLIPPFKKGGRRSFDFTGSRKMFN